LYAGLPIVMKTPPDQALGYAVVVIVSALVMFVVIGVIASRFVAAPMIAGA